MSVGGRVDAKYILRLPTLFACVVIILFVVLFYGCAKKTHLPRVESWESVTIDCQSDITDPNDPNYPVVPYKAVIKRNGFLFWKGKSGEEFTILNIKDKNSGKPSTPFREPSGQKKFTVKSIEGRTAGDMAKEEGEFKYDIKCANGKILDPMIDVPRP